MRTSEHLDAITQEDFDVNRYLGDWYEIARLDNSFEKGLEQTKANYKLRPDGGIDVTNSGYDPQKKKWKESRGKAYFVGSSNIASLKVSFFGTVYGGYNIIALDENYRYALVCGPNFDYLWILSRTKVLNDTVKQSLVNQAKQLGFATDKLIWVKHN